MRQLAKIWNMTTLLSGDKSNADVIAHEIAYEKGSKFLWYLEDIVGGKSYFEPFTFSDAVYKEVCLPIN